MYNLDRVDENISDADRVWFRYGYDAPTSYAVQYFNNAANPSALSGWKDYHAQATWNHIFTASMANEFRFGMVQEDNFASPVTSNVSSIGLQGVPLTQFPSVSITGLTSLGAGSYSRTRDRQRARSSVRYWLLVFSLIATAVIVAAAMLECLYLLLR